MRMLKSVNYFEQMKGRGTRTINNDTFQKVSCTAKSKTHFVILDAIGDSKSRKTDSCPLAWIIHSSKFFCDFTEFVVGRRYILDYPNGLIINGFKKMQFFRSR